MKERSSVVAPPNLPLFLLLVFSSSFAKRIRSCTPSPFCEMNVDTWFQPSSPLSVETKFLEMSLLLPSSSTDLNISVPRTRTGCTTDHHFVLDYSKNIQDILPCYVEIPMGFSWLYKFGSIWLSGILTCEYSLFFSSYMRFFYCFTTFLPQSILSLPSST